MMAAANLRADEDDVVLDIRAISARATLTVDEAALVLGIGRTAAYEAARRGQLPTRRLGRRLFVPVPAFLEWLGAPAASDVASSVRTRPSSEA